VELMDEKMVRSVVRSYILRELVRDEGYPLRDDEGIITGGLMDSFALAEFAVFVEDEFNVYIPDSDLTVTKMNTSEQMVSRVMAG